MGCTSVLDEVSSAAGVLMEEGGRGTCRVAGHAAAAEVRPAGDVVTRGGKEAVRNCPPSWALCVTELHCVCVCVCMACTVASFWNKLAPSFLGWNARQQFKFWLSELFFIRLDNLITCKF